MCEYDQKAMGYASPPSQSHRDEEPPPISSKRNVEEGEAGILPQREALGVLYLQASR